MADETTTPLLPLPETHTAGEFAKDVRVYDASQVRAIVAHATAAKDAEIEALWAEVEDLEVQVAGLTVVVEHHTAYAITHRGALRYCNANMRDAYSAEKVRAETACARAERLAEALRPVAERGEISAEIIRKARAALHPTAAQESE